MLGPPRREVNEGTAPNPAYWSFAYSALASFRMGMSGSASFQRAKKCSLRQVHAAQQVGVAWIGADTIKDWFNLDPRKLVVSHLIGFLQPFKCSILLSKGAVNSRKVKRGDVTALGRSSELVDDIVRFGSFPCYGESTSHSGYVSRRAARIRRCFLCFGNRFSVKPLLPIRSRQPEMRLGKSRFQLKGSIPLLDGAVIFARS